MIFGLRFDCRNPGLAGTSASDRYRAVLDMCEWADERGTYAAELAAAGAFAFAVLHPMVGGIPPDLAWRHLRLFEKALLPPGQLS
jgi:hypothetical protein